MLDGRVEVAEVEAEFASESVGDLARLDSCDFCECFGRRLSALLELVQLERHFEVSQDFKFARVNDDLFWRSHGFLRVELSTHIDFL